MNQRRIHAPEKRRSESGRMWLRPVLLKYWAMQLPGTAIVLLCVLGLADGFGWPRWVVWASVAAWTAKDALLYPLVWRAYDPDYPTPFPYRMEGATGVAVDRIEPSGTVRIWGELWHAELYLRQPPVEAGETVRVKARDGLTLLVEPAETR